MNPKKPFLSIIIPVYNESKRLSSLNKITNFFKKTLYPVELILVNDGSTDVTLAKLNKLANKLKFKIISYPINQGKGFAVKQGMLSASGRYSGFMDIDLSTPLEQIDSFLKYFPQSDVVIGSRRLNQSNVIKSQPWIRQTLGKGFTFICQKVLNLPYSDFTCGLKIFKTIAARKIFKKLSINRWGFDAEMLFIAHNLGLKIKETPVSWINDDRSQVKLSSDIIGSLKELLTIRLNHFKKIYKF